MAKSYLDLLPPELLCRIFELLDLDSINGLVRANNRAQATLENISNFSHLLNNYSFSQVTSFGPPQDRKIWIVKPHEWGIRTYVCRPPPSCHPSIEANNNLLQGLILLSEGAEAEHDKHTHLTKRRLAICDKIIRELPPLQLKERNLIVTLRLGAQTSHLDQWREYDVGMEGWRLILQIKESCHQVGLLLSACGGIWSRDAYNTLMGAELKKMQIAALTSLANSSNSPSPLPPLKIHVSRVDCYSLDEVKAFYSMLENKSVFELTVSQEAVFFPPCTCVTRDGCFGPITLPTSSELVDKIITVYFDNPHLPTTRTTTYYLSPDDYNWHLYEGPSLDRTIVRRGALRYLTIFEC